MNAVEGRMEEISKAAGGRLGLGAAQARLHERVEIAHEMDLVDFQRTQGHPSPVRPASLVA